MDSGHGSGPLSDAFVAEVVGNPRPGSSRCIAAPLNVSQLEVHRSIRVASRSQSAQYAPPGTRRAVSNALPSLVEASPSLHAPSPSLRAQFAAPSDPTGNAGDFRGIDIPQVSLEPARSNFGGRKCSATSDAHRLPRQARGPSAYRSPSPSHFRPPAHVLPSVHPNPTTPPRSIQSQCSAVNVAPLSSPIDSNPLLQSRLDPSIHTPSPARRLSTSFHTRDSNAAWAAAEGLLPICDAFKAPGYVPAHIVGGISYNVHSPRSERSRPVGSATDNQASADCPVPSAFVPMGSQSQPSERIQTDHMHFPSMQARMFTPSVRLFIFGIFPSNDAHIVTFT
ncbi:hypothetical protein BYT27DRAFT_7092855 [Phlegmacium glaucopus]|nr:hypothetical protein BYT27DRAFT_7092855 [Phlegmacium glaucopus]